jgi:hypothetical protein
MKDKTVLSSDLFHALFSACSDNQHHPRIKKINLHSLVGPCLTIVFALTVSFAFSQGEIPVDMYSGTPVIQIPLHTITDHDLSETIGIAYNTAGIKLEDQTGIGGLGWNIRAGGSIYRQVRGLPDDYLPDAPADTRRGWLYNSNALAASNFSNSVDLSATTITDEADAYTALQSNNYKHDTEPDIYYYSAAGISGAFVFDNSLNIRLMPYQDVKIEYTISQITNRIASFTITSNVGTKYKFLTPVPLTRSTHRLTGGNPVEFLKRDFEEYNVDVYNPGVSYNMEWKLTEIESTSGAKLTYAYSTELSDSSDPVKVFIRKNGSTSDFVEKDNFYYKHVYNKRELVSITSTTGEVVLFDGLLKITVTNKRRQDPYVKEFQFEYASVLDQDSTESGFRRTFLKSITEVANCTKLPPYKFTYTNVDFTNNICDLPAIDSNAKDFWGYYNGKNSNTNSYPKLYIYPNEVVSERIRIYPKPNHSGPEYTINGADRMPNAAAMQIGSLKMINYPTGGSTIINYEPHEFYDPGAGQTFIGGGLRVKSIVTYDGVNAANKMIRNFEYTEVSGASSGRLINKPSFAIPTLEYRDPEGTEVKSWTALVGNTQSMYEHLIVRTNIDLNRDVEGDIIGYSRVKVSRPGSGSAEFEYALPATSGTTRSGSWVVTENKFVRDSSQPQMGIAPNGGTSIFPYASNPNYTYERGYQLKKIEKNEASTKVREVTYVPQRIHKTGATPTKVWGISYDYYPYSDKSSTDPIFFFGNISC